LFSGDKQLSVVFVPFLEIEENLQLRLARVIARFASDQVAPPSATNVSVVVLS